MLLLKSQKEEYAKTVFIRKNINYKEIKDCIKEEVDEINDNKEISKDKVKEE